jgi:hypothetical protein
MNDSKKRTTSAAIRALCAAVLAGSAAAPAMAGDTLVATDTAWRVTALGPGVGWETSTSFNDASWQSAIAVYEVSPYLGPDYAGTQAIWTQAGQYSTTDTTIWGRMVVNLGTPLQSATLEYGIDDDGDIFVNGVLVVSDHNGMANGGLVDITSYLTAGANVIAFTATDNYAVWGYNHAAWIRIEGTVAAVPEPSTYATLLLGLGMLGLMRGRLRRNDRR